MKMANDLVSIFGVNGQLLYILTLGIVINPDAFAIGFGERMCTFSQEKTRSFESCEDSFMMGVCVCAMLRLILINQFR